MAILVGIGGVVLNLIFAIGYALIIAIIAGIGWVWQKLTGGDQ